MADYVTKRGEKYYYFRRVPSEVSQFDTRAAVRLSLKTGDIKIARAQADIYNRQIEEFWRSLLATGSTFSEQEYKRAVGMARANGFSYRTAADIARLPINEIIERVMTAANQSGEVVKAVLGGVDRPELPLKDCLERYWPQCVDRNVRKSTHQIHKWRTPRIDAWNRFMDVAGAEKSITDITRKDALDFRAYWAKKILDEKRSADTANKQIHTIQDILQTVALAANFEIDFKIMFAGTAFKENKKSRPPFEATFVQNVLLRPENLKTMNDDARYIIYAMADTGARISELVGLKPADIILDHEIPHISIEEEDDRQLKTKHSARKIPLVGAALFAFQRMPNGFTRYENADSASAAINKYLREHDLLPSPDHSCYSLRHTFKDRLRDISAPDELIDSLMGHDSVGPKYGRGHILETKKLWLDKIAYAVNRSTP